MLQAFDTAHTVAMQHAEDDFTTLEIIHSTRRYELVQATDLSNSSCAEIGELHCRQALNDVRGLNRFFKQVNEHLEQEGLFCASVETLEQRRNRILRSLPPVLNLLIYALDFGFYRILPKFRSTKGLYFRLSSGRNRALSKSEVLGRLIYCGFAIQEIREEAGKLFFTARKVAKPSTEAEPSTGLLLRIRRIGRHGRPIIVYKLRTMHPYAQYLQQYVFDCNHLKEGGKFANDFRITKWGRWMRRLWIDELPMIYNIIKGDIKLVGVRPLSEHYFNLYTPEHRALRIREKPGLIPPFYADLPRSLDEIMDSESRYVRAYEQRPFTTDFNYCIKAFGNILIHKARSQ